MFRLRTLISRPAVSAPAKPELREEIRPMRLRIETLEERIAPYVFKLLDKATPL
jgi:hypothetical protein